MLIYCHLKTPLCCFILTHELSHAKTHKELWPWYMAIVLTDIFITVTVNYIFHLFSYFCCLWHIYISREATLTFISPVQNTYLGPDLSMHSTVTFFSTWCLSRRAWLNIQSIVYTSLMHDTSSGRCSDAFFLLSLMCELAQCGVRFCWWYYFGFSLSLHRNRPPWKVVGLFIDSQMGDAHKHWIFTDTRTLAQNFSEQSSVTVLFNGAGHLKFARDERRAWIDVANCETEHRFDSSWQAESLKHCFLTQIPSIIYNPEPWVHAIWKWFRLLEDEDIPPAPWEVATLCLFVIGCHTKCCCYAQTLVLIISH